MTLTLAFFLLALSGSAGQQPTPPPPPPPPATEQEKPVDQSSARITVLGCLRGKNLQAIEHTGDEPVSTSIAPGRVLRLSGEKTLMKDLGKHDKQVVQVTGLVRRNTVDKPQGMPIGAGGRIRIGGMPMNQDPTRMDGRDPLANVDYMDVESFRPADGVCPTKK